MGKVLSGPEVSRSLNEELKKRVQRLAAKGAVPSLAIVRIGENAGDIAYERGAFKRCAAVGVKCTSVQLSRDVPQDELASVMVRLNHDDSVHGVLLLRPLPAGIDEAYVVNLLDARKDVDCMTDISLSTLLSGRGPGFAPCTAEAAMAFLDHYGIGQAGKRAVVIGRSLVIGKPAALMLINRSATVTVCHTKTKDMPSLAREADIIVSAAGHPHTVTRECVRPGQTVIDVGINAGTDGRLCGDADFEEIKDIVDAITPVPGGVGAVTTAVLARHVIEACEAAMYAY